MSGRYTVETVTLDGGSIVSSLMPVAGYNGNVLMFCYGGSFTFSRYKTFPFLEWFTDAGWGAVAFDYYGMGVGLPEEKIKKYTGLFTRVRDAQHVLMYVRKKFNPNRFVVMGHSMGCPVAIHAVAGRSDIDGLILSAPAAYAREVIDRCLTFENWKPFLEGGSWQNSETFGVVKDMTIPCHIIRYRGDTVVNTASGDIPAAYFNRAARKGLQLSTIDGGKGGHKLFGDSPDTFAKQQKVAVMALEWLGEKDWGSDYTEEEAAVQEILLSC